MGRMGWKRRYGLLSLVSQALISCRMFKTLAGGGSGGQGSNGWTNSEVLVLGGDDKKGEDGDVGIFGNMMTYFRGMRDRMKKGKKGDDDEVIVMSTGHGGGGDHGGGGGGGGTAFPQSFSR